MAFSDGKSTLAKLATIFAVGFGISLGLCGLNFLILAGGGAVGRSGGSSVLIMFAYLELAGMATCSIGLLIVGLISLLKIIGHSFSKPPGSTEDH